MSAAALMDMAWGGMAWNDTPEERWVGGEGGGEGGVEAAWCKGSQRLDARSKKAHASRRCSLG